MEGIVNNYRCDRSIVVFFSYCEKKKLGKLDLNERELLKEWDLEEIFEGFNDRLRSIELDSNVIESKPKYNGIFDIGLNNKISKNVSEKVVNKTMDASSFQESQNLVKDVPNFPLRPRYSAAFLDNNPISIKTNGPSVKNRRSSETTVFLLKKDLDTIHTSLSKNSDKKVSNDETKEETYVKISDFTSNFKNVNIMSPSRPRREKTDGEIIVKLSNERKTELKNLGLVQNLKIKELEMSNSALLEKDKLNDGNNVYETILRTFSFSDLQSEVSF